MKKLKYDASGLLIELIKHNISHKDTAAIGELMIALQSNIAVLKDTDLNEYIPFMHKSSIKRLINRIDGKILRVIQQDKDLRLRVIEWTIDWAQFVYEIKT